MLKQFVLCIIFAICAGSIPFELTFAQKGPKKYNQEITLDTAKKFINNLKSDVSEMKLKGGMFFREGLEKILSQKDCIGVRFYFAKTDDNLPTLIGVGVDSTGNDITKVMVEHILPCPPNCSWESVLIK